MAVQIHRIFNAGAGLTGIAILVAAALDMYSEGKALKDIAAVHIPVQQRVTDCQNENQACSTSHEALDLCLQEKASKQVADINPILDRRDQEKFFYRMTMLFSMVYLGMLLVMGRINRPQAAKPQSPAPDQTPPAPH